MPRYDRYVKLRETLANSVVRGTATVKWAEDGKSFSYDKGGKSMVYTIATAKEVEGTLPTPAAPTTTPGRRRGGGGAPARGRQFDTAFNADQTLKAVSKDRNIILTDGKGNNSINVTTEGSAEKRLKFGIASWVYGEELEVREAMWFSPDGKKLAFYKFDESKVLDYYLTMDQKQIQTKLDVEAYPKAGAPNPEVTLLVYDIASKTTKAIDTKFADATLGEYVYAVRWSPDGTELLFNRTNRRQNTLELCAANPETGTCRTILQEKTANGWVDNSPAIQWLADSKRFIWISERNGYRNLYLYDISGKLIRPLTQANFEVEGVKKLDEKSGLLFYTARSAPNPYLRQLHRVRLDGKGETRLTDPALSHTVDIAPDNATFVDVAETTDTPPVTTVRDMKGKALVELAKSDLTKFDAAGFKKTERFTFTAADRKTTCYGSIQFPSDFDPAKKWPVIVSVYGGPDSGGGIERFQTPDAITELGFLHVQMDGRGTAGRGTAFKDAVYEKLGVVEIDDHAAGILELAKRPYVDGKHVGIYGTSYGGYFSALALLRHPEAFAAASASSPVTDWRNYDSIYTERYMWIPQENEEGYDAGSAIKLAKNLKGRLLLYFGSADNNVHPSNSFQLIGALAGASKSFDLVAGPDLGHTGVNNARMWEFFIDNLMDRRTTSLSGQYQKILDRRRSLARLGS